VVDSGTDAGELHASRHGHWNPAVCGGAIALRVEETGKGEHVSLGLFDWHKWHAGTPSSTPTHSTSWPWLLLPPQHMAAPVDATRAQV